MIATDITAGQNWYTTAGSGANTTTANNTSSENRTENQSDVPNRRTFQMIYKTLI